VWRRATGLRVTAVYGDSLASAAIIGSRRPRPIRWRALQKIRGAIIVEQPARLAGCGTAEERPEREALFAGGDRSEPVGGTRCGVIDNRRASAMTAS